MLFFDCARSRAGRNRARAGGAQTEMEITMDEISVRRLLGNLIGGQGTADIGAAGNAVPAFAKLDESVIRGLNPASRNGAGGFAGLVGGTQNASADTSKASNGIFAGAAAAPTKGAIVPAFVPDGFTQEETFVDGPNGEIYSIVATGPDPVCTPGGFANSRAVCTVSGVNRDFEQPSVVVYLEDDLGRERIDSVDVPPKHRGFCAIDFRKTPPIQCGRIPLGDDESEFI